MAFNIMGYALGIYHICMIYMRGEYIIYIYMIYMRGKEATEQVTVGNSITKEA